jgi:hypothetical protein
MGRADRVFKASLSFAVAVYISPDELGQREVDLLRRGEANSGASWPRGTALALRVDAEYEGGPISTVRAGG